MNSEITPQPIKKQQLQKETTKLGPYEKLAKIGMLVNGYAHDLNNVLTGIMGNLELYKLNLPPEAEDNKHLKRLDHFAKRISQLTRDMLLCGRKGKPNLQPIRLNEIIEDFLPQLTANLPPSVRVNLDLGHDLPQVNADSAQIIFIIAALWENAIEAVDTNGQITVATRLLEVEDDPEAITPRPGKYIAFSLSDDGYGMDDDAKEKIFNPLFSTKPDGDGMGMAVVQTVVQNHAGWLAIDTAVDSGTTVNIYLAAV